MAAGKKKAAKGGKKSSVSVIRRLARMACLFTGFGWIVVSAIGMWFVGHSNEWLAEKRDTWPGFCFRPLMYCGDRAVMISDAFGWTGHDAVYDADDWCAEDGSVFFAGEPKRIGGNVPADIVRIDRGDYVSAFSPSLGHPVWVAYHVPAEALYEVGNRPGFRMDRSVKGSPAAAAYDRTGYDRGHMAPNYAMASRFGADAQAETFYMTNIAPQRPDLNRGPWKYMEHLIADFWTAKYGEIWVIVGALPAQGGARETLPGTNVDVPPGFWMVIAAQEKTESDNGGESVQVRALAVKIMQSAESDEFPVHDIVSIDELENETGLDFFSAMPGYLQKPLEAELPTRLWPIRAWDAFKLLHLRWTL